MELEELQKIVRSRATYRGLTTESAKERLGLYGPNARAVKKPVRWFVRLWRIISEPMTLLLLVTAVVYFFVGTLFETVILALSVIPLIIIQFFQEQKTDEALRALDNLLTENCQVFRDGTAGALDLRFVVPGDFVYLTAGDKIPADGYLLSSPGALVDEAILTGESMPVAKSVVPSNLKTNESEHLLLQGTLLVQGEGYMLVTATGAATAYGKLGSLLEKIDLVETPLQKKIHSLVKILAVAAVVTAIFFGVVLSLERGFISGLLGALTISIAIIPEEFPIVFSVFLIMGVWRMSKRQALVREMAMVETLGSATVICTDKTGTLTEGTMALEAVLYNKKLIQLSEKKVSSEKYEPLIRSATLALEQVAVDPIEHEVQRFATAIGLSKVVLRNKYRLLKDSSFEASSKTVSHIWQDPDGDICQYTAGAPESILQKSALSDRERARLEAVYEDMATQGYRCIGVATLALKNGEKFVTEGLTFVGFLFMSDPVRKGVPEAIGVCQKAGIRVIMITGDSPLTALAIGKKIGLTARRAVLGDEIEKATDESLSQLVKKNCIFARVRPEQKYRLVEALQKQGEIVAMTGDGVNDAPALKKAQIGIAMGKKGTEVARAAAGIVLLDDTFPTIVSAVEEGRRIYDNLRQAFVFLFSFHIPIIFLSFFPIVIGQNLFFLPIHIVFMELFCDPASVLGFERDKARRHVMIDPPRKATEPLLSLKLLIRVAVQGIGITGIATGLYYYGIVVGSPELGRTLGMSALVMTQVFLILFTREWQQVKSNWLLLVISVLTLGMVVLWTVVPVIQAAFRFVPIPLAVFGEVVVLSVVVALGMAVVTKLLKK
jgi:Ca2+-transporting ATPase